MISPLPHLPEPNTALPIEDPLNASKALEPRFLALSHALDAAEPTLEATLFALSYAPEAKFFTVLYAVEAARPTALLDIDLITEDPTLPILDRTEFTLLEMPLPILANHSPTNFAIPAAFLAIPAINPSITSLALVDIPL